MPSVDADDSTETPETIDWTSIDSRAHRNGAPSDASRREPDSPSELLASDAPLDPERSRVAISHLHPDRLRPAGPEKKAELEAAVAADLHPKAWVDRINPGFLADAEAGLPGRTENCAECARAFQSTLEGHPAVAAEISGSGLPAAGDNPTSGEAICYTEQWAGRVSEHLGWAQVEQRVAETGGSAIVFAWGPEGGHAINAYTGPDGNVRWADAQIGETGPWPPGELRSRFPETRAIVFDRGDRR